MVEPEVQIEAIGHTQLYEEYELDLDIVKPLLLDSIFFAEEVKVVDNRCLSCISEKILVQ